MNIWLVSIFEQTPIDNVFSTRFNSIANEALKRGHSITFFASTFKHNTKIQRFQETHTEVINANYKIVFVKSASYTKNISIARLLSHYSFAKDVLIEMKTQAKPDVILMAYPPVSLAKFVSTWAKQNKIPVILDVIDPWPDAFVVPFPKYLHFLIKAVLFPIKLSTIKTLTNLTAPTSISKQYIDWGKSINRKLSVCEVFYPAADYEFIRSRIDAHKTSKNGKFLSIVYAGSLALVYDINTILKAAEILDADYPDIRFFIAGSGLHQSKVLNYIRNHSNLEYFGRLSKEDLMKVYAMSDLGLTQYIKGTTQSVTYKLFDLLSAGLPILNSLESEMKEIILDNKVGLHNKPGDYKQLAENILIFYNDKSKIKEYQNNGYELTIKLGDSKKVYSDFVKLLEQISDKNAV